MKLNIKLYKKGGETFPSLKVTEYLYTKKLKYWEKLFAE